MVKNSSSFSRGRPIWLWAFALTPALALGGPASAAPRGPATLRTVAQPLLPPAPQLPPAQLTASVDAQPRDHAGQRRAGLMCFPNGALRIKDFVPAEGDFQLAADRALRDLGASATPLRAAGVTFTLHLKAVKASLCARSWGVFGRGDRSSLSGTATVTFAWSLARPQHPREATADVLIDVARDQAATPVEILRRAVTRVFQLVLASEATTSG